jgi:hypothetical protein
MDRSRTGKFLPVLNYTSLRYVQFLLCSGPNVSKAKLRSGSLRDSQTVCPQSSGSRLATPTTIKWEELHPLFIDVSIIWFQKPFHCCYHIFISFEIKDIVLQRRKKPRSRSGGDMLKNITIVGSFMF